MYVIREVDGGDPEFELELDVLHRVSFQDGTSVPDFNEGFWWIAFYGPHAIPAAFIGAKNSILGPHTGYFFRVGVSPEHRGKGLQRRLMRAMERKARKIGWVRIVSDTRNNHHSANNIIDAGYRMYDPDAPWGFSDASYWSKEIK